MSDDADARDTAGNLAPLHAGNDRRDPRDLIWGEYKAAIERRLRNLDPDLEEYVREFVYKDTVIAS